MCKFLSVRYFSNLGKFALMTSLVCSEDDIEDIHKASLLLSTCSHTADCQNAYMACILMLQCLAGSVSAGQMLLAKHHRVLCIHHATWHNRAADHHGAYGNLRF